MCALAAPTCWPTSGTIDAAGLGDRHATGGCTGIAVRSRCSPRHRKRVWRTKSYAENILDRAARVGGFVDGHVPGGTGSVVAATADGACARYDRSGRWFVADCKIA